MIHSRPHFPHPKWLPLKISLLLFIWTFPSRLPAEQIFDSLDQLDVNRISAAERAKNGFLTDALQAEEKALKAQEYLDGPIHPDLIPLLTDLATLDRYLGRFADAESTLKWALAIREKTSGPENPLLVQPLYSLTSLYVDWGHWDDAEFYGNKAVSIMEKQEEAPSVPFWQAFKLMGQIKLGLQENGKALSFFKKSLDAGEKESNLAPIEKIHIFDLMAEAYIPLQRPSDAEACLGKALDIAKNNFKENNVEVADGLKNFGDFYLSQAQENKAKSLYTSSLEIYHQLVGTFFGYSSIPYVQRLAKAELSMSQFKDAGDLLEKNLQAVKDVYGPTHPRVAVALFDLAGAEKGLGHTEQARKDLQEALQIAETFYREDYPLVVSIKKQLH